MIVKVDIKGLDKDMKRLKMLKNILDRELIKTVNDQGLKWQGIVKAKTPVDNGDLRNSWVLDPASKSGKNIEIDLSNNLEYAEYVEYGHRQEVGRFVKAIGKRLKKPYVNGVYMLRDGTSLIEKSLPKAIRATIKRVVAI